MSQLQDAHKQALRLAAVGALLHNLGKIHSKFLDKQINSSQNGYLYQHILNLIAPYVTCLPTDWQANYNTNKLNASNVLDRSTVTALKTLFSLPTPLDDLDDRTDYAIGNLIEYLGQGEPWYNNMNGRYGIEHIFPQGSRLTHLMNRAHRGASGGEKEEIATAQQPDANDLYLSTPFGYETVAPNISNINNLLQEIELVIQNYLSAPVEPFSLVEFVAEIRPLFSQALADTQRPLNDITIGDIGHTGMAFLLSQAAEWLLTQRPIDHAELAQKENDNTLFWRVLTIQADILRYLEEAGSLADLRVRQKQVKEQFDRIRQNLAETMLAVEIYADEQRLLFVFPNIDQSHAAYEKVVQEIRKDLQIDGLNLVIGLSAPVTNHPKDKNADYIGDEVLKQLQTDPPYTVNAEALTTFWSSEPETEGRSQICIACNIRPQGYGAEQVAAYQRNPNYYRDKAKKRSICCVCLNRRSGVAENWVKQELHQTVWLDEVADIHGRVALIIGQWHINDFAQSISYPKKQRNANERQEPDFFRRLESPTPWIKLVDLQGGSLPPQISIGRPAVVYNQNHLGWFVGEQVSDCPNKFQSPRFPSLNLEVDEIYEENGAYLIRLKTPHQLSGNVQLVGQNFTVVDNYTFSTVDQAGRNQVANLFLHDRQFVVSACIQVHPTISNYSFARLRRIWQTTKDFWNTAVSEANIPPIPNRLQIKGKLSKNDNLGAYHAYELVLPNHLRLSVVWDADNQRFISCDNLAYLEKLGGDSVTSQLKAGQTITIEEPTGYGSKNKTWGTITLTEDASDLPNSSYTPIIPILAEPRTFMALVPADQAIQIVTAIKTKYEQEMGKVRNRLPLHLGIVYAQRRTPLRAVLDAGRRMLKYELGRMKDDLWTVAEDVQVESLPTHQGTQFATTIHVQLKQNRRQLTWHVPAKMGDGQTDDNWYPYVFVQGDMSGRAFAFQAPRPKSDDTAETCWLLHASQLNKDDKVYFTPATLDFEWLDTTGRRFEIAYDQQGQRCNHLTRPYLLDDLDQMQQAWGILKKLSKNQLYALRDTIETKREAWFAEPQTSLYDQTFKQFCADVVANTKGIPKTARKTVTDWAVSGLLADTVQLYVTIMKQKQEPPDNQETE